MLRVLLAAWLAFVPVAQPTAPGPAKPLTLAQVWTLDGTFNDPQHGVSFRYPAVWQATTQFAYHPPALTQSDVAKPIAAFGFSEGGFPRKQLVGPYGRTNLEGVSLVYSAVPAASVAECSAKAASVTGSLKGLPASSESTPSLCTKRRVQACHSPLPGSFMRPTPGPLAICSRRIWQWFHLGSWIISRRLRRLSSPLSIHT
jgi:hypothetical protein